jgi:iron complex transport system substrate-binding protein
MYSELKQIAATVNAEDPGGEDWRLDFRLYGEAVGRPDAAERLLHDYDARMARLRRRLRRGTRVSLVRTLPGGVRAYCAGSFAGTILDDAGLERPTAQSQPLASVAVSPEQLPALDADLVLLSRAPGDRDTYRRLLSDPRWRSLRAVRAGRVHTVRDDPWMVGQGMLAARVVISDLDRLLGR